MQLYKQFMFCPKSFLLSAAVHCSTTFCAVNCQFYGYKINLDKTLLIPLNNTAKHFVLPAIPSRITLH